MKTLERGAITQPLKRWVNLLGEAALGTLTIAVLLLGEGYFSSKTALQGKITPKRNQK